MSAGEICGGCIEDSGGQPGWGPSSFECSEEMSYGVRSIQGQRASMEDSFCVEHLKLKTGIRCPTSPFSNSRVGMFHSAATEDVYSFYGVYDGHGGTEAARHCSARLHVNLQRRLEEHMQESKLSPTSSDDCLDPLSSSSDASSTEFFDTNSWAEEYKAFVERRGSLSCSAQQRPHFNGLHGAYSQTAENSTAVHMDKAIREAFQRTDDELCGSLSGDFVGSTAVVAVVGRQQVWIAHCGDSRAVVARNGVAVSSTMDHKPQRQDELARVQAAGGRIIFHGGGYRVMGLLAMSRAIGDHFLRPYVICDPEVGVVPRTEDDQYLILATDGLWDVFTCQEAVTLATKSMERAQERGASRSAACRIAASVLTKVAIDKGSKDNITVLVVDMSLPKVASNGLVTKGSGLVDVNVRRHWSCSSLPIGRVRSEPLDVYGPPAKYLRVGLLSTGDCVPSLRSTDCSVPPRKSRLVETGLMS